MKNYLITFYWERDTNSELAVTLRAKLERHSPDYWVHIFPNQVAIKSDMEIHDLYNLLLPEAEKTRIYIVEFSESFINDLSRNHILKDKGY